MSVCVSVRVCACVCSCLFVIVAIDQANRYLARHEAHIRQSPWMVCCRCTHVCCAAVPVDELVSLCSRFWSDTCVIDVGLLCCRGCRSCSMRTERSAPIAARHRRGALAVWLRCSLTFTHSSIPCACEIVTVARLCFPGVASSLSRCSPSCYGGAVWQSFLAEPFVFLRW